MTAPGLAHRASVLENGEIILTGVAAEVATDDHARRASLGIRAGRPPVPASNDPRA